MREKVIIIGAGGHSKVIADIILKNNDNLIGFLDDNIPDETNVIGKYKVIGKIKEGIELYCKDNSIKFIIAIGDNYIREDISKKYSLKYYNAIHPTASIGLDVKIGEGTVVMANASINSNANIGKHCIINTGSIVEHDNIINDFVHLSPKVALGGNVKIGERTHIGIGATIRNNISINCNVVVGAGAVVVSNIQEEGTYIGVPAKIMKK